MLSFFDPLRQHHGVHQGGIGWASQPHRRYLQGELIVENTLQYSIGLFLSDHWHIVFRSPGWRSWRRPVKKQSPALTYGRATPSSMWATQSPRRGVCFLPRANLISPGPSNVTGPRKMGSPRRADFWRAHRAVPRAPQADQSRVAPQSKIHIGADSKNTIVALFWPESPFN